MMVQNRFGPLQLLWFYRQLLIQTTKADLRSRFAGSTIGIFWLLIYPLLLLAVYSVVYVQVLKIRFETLSSFEYVLYIFSGLIPFLGFSEALASSSVSITGNANLIKNSLFPAQIIPVKSVFVSQSSSFVGLAILLILLLFKGMLGAAALLLIPIWFLQVVMTIGVAWILSSLNVLLRDLQNVIGLINMILMMGSPIAYTMDMIPQRLRYVYYFNPLYYVIIAYQDVLIRNKIPEPGILMGLVCISLITYLVGYLLFMKMREVLADYV